MNRPNTRSGLAADIGSAATYSNQYYYGTDTGIYYYSNGTSWTVKTFDEGRSVVNQSGTIATGGTAQLLLAANTDRRWFFFQNTSNDDMYLGFGYTPTTTNGIFVAKSGTIFQLSDFVPTDAVFVFCANSTKTFCCLEG
jgi:hypothetical protein